MINKRSKHIGSLFDDMDRYGNSNITELLHQTILKGMHLMTPKQTRKTTIQVKTKGTPYMYY